MNVGRYLRGEDRHVGTARTTQPQPQQRTWVGLTPTDWLEALKDIDPETKRLPQGFSLFACAIEAKLKEKNNA